MSDDGEKEQAELRARLAKAQAELGELQRKRDERELQAADRRKVEALEREARNEVAIAAAVEEHGDIGTKIAVVDTDLGVIIVKRSSPVLFKRFQQVGSTKWEDLDKLVRPCLVHPDKAGFDTILDELPATLLRVADAVVTLAGARAREVGEK